MMEINGQDFYKLKKVGNYDNKVPMADKSN